MKRSENAPAHILAVDDDAVACQLLVEILSDEGYRVESASGGREAVEHLEKGFYDLIITDLKMPGWDGLEVLRRYK
jgi:CheY-like chemotaxis protein